MVGGCGLMVMGPFHVYRVGMTPCGVGWIHPALRGMVVVSGAVGQE